MFSAVKDSLQSLRGNNDCVGRRLSDCTNRLGHNRLPVLSHIEPGQSLSQHVVCPAFCLALGHETTLLQQLRPVLLQKPLDRSRTRLMWSNVDVADALSHALSSRPLCRTKPKKITFADRSRQSKREVVRRGCADRHKC